MDYDIDLLEDLARDSMVLKEPDRELDAKIGLALGWIHKCDTLRWGIGAPHWSLNGESQSEVLGYWHSDDQGSLPYFTASLDAVRTVIDIIGECRYGTLRKSDGLGFSCFVEWSPNSYQNSSCDGYLEAATLCAATLQALISKIRAAKTAELVSSVCQTA